MRPIHDLAIEDMKRSTRDHHEHPGFHLTSANLFGNVFSKLPQNRHPESL